MLDIGLCDSIYGELARDAIPFLPDTVERPAIESRWLTAADAFYSAITAPLGVTRSVLHKAAQLRRRFGCQAGAVLPERNDSGRHPPHPDRALTDPAEDIRAYVDVKRQQQLSAYAEELRVTGLNASAHVEWDTRSDDGILREVLRRRPDFVVIEAFSRKLLTIVSSPYLTHHEAHGNLSVPTSPGAKRVSLSVAPPDSGCGGSDARPCQSGRTGR